LQARESELSSYQQSFVGHFLSCVMQASPKNVANSFYREHLRLIHGVFVCEDSDCAENLLEGAPRGEDIGSLKEQHRDCKRGTTYGDQQRRWNRIFKIIYPQWPGPIPDWEWKGIRIEEFFLATALVLREHSRLGAAGNALADPAPERRRGNVVAAPSASEDAVSIDMPHPREETPSVRTSRSSVPNTGSTPSGGSSQALHMTNETSSASVRAPSTILGPVIPRHPANMIINEKFDDLVACNEKRPNETDFYAQLNARDKYISHLQCELQASNLTCQKLLQRVAILEETLDRTRNSMQGILAHLVPRSTVSEPEPMQANYIMASNTRHAQISFFCDRKSINTAIWISLG
jgi:hypothetical protein